MHQVVQGHCRVKELDNLFFRSKIWVVEHAEKMKTGTQFLLNLRMKTAMIYPKYDSLVKTGIMKKSAKKEMTSLKKLVLYS